MGRFLKVIFDLDYIYTHILNSHIEESYKVTTVFGIESIGKYVLNFQLFLFH